MREPDIEYVACGYFLSTIIWTFGCSWGWSKRWSFLKHDEERELCTGESVAKYIRGTSPYNTQIVALGVDTYLKMLLADNFVHTDLHPGNIMIRPRPLPGAAVEYGTAPAPNLRAVGKSLHAPTQLWMNLTLTGMALAQGSAIQDMSAVSIYRCAKSRCALDREQRCLTAQAHHSCLACRQRPGVAVQAADGVA